MNRRGDSRAWKRNIPRWLTSLRGRGIAESYNDRLIGRASNNWCVARAPPPRLVSSQQLRIASRRFGVRSSSAETNSAKRSGEHLIARAVACVHMMRIRNTHSARARIVRKCEIGESRVVRAVTLVDRFACVFGNLRRSGDRSFRVAKWRYTACIYAVYREENI